LGLPAIRSRSPDHVQDHSRLRFPAPCLLRRTGVARVSQPRPPPAQAGCRRPRSVARCLRSALQPGRRRRLRRGHIARRSPLCAGVPAGHRPRHRRPLSYLPGAEGLPRRSQQLRLPRPSQSSAGPRGPNPGGVPCLIVSKQHARGSPAASRIGAFAHATAWRVSRAPGRTSAAVSTQTRLSRSCSIASIRPAGIRFSC